MRFRTGSRSYPTSAARPRAEARALIPRILGRPLRGDANALRRSAADQLQLSPGDSVLEIGCGDGRLLLELVARTPRGTSVVGIEPDEWMLRHAIARTRSLIERGRVSVLQTESSDLSGLPNAHFDKACAVDVIYFWSNPARDLAEIRRVLRPDGRLLLGYAASNAPAVSRGDELVRPAEEVEGWLREAGFVGVNSVRSKAGDGREALTWTGGSRAADPPVPAS